jgi:hypothetical protein
MVPLPFSLAHADNVPFHNGDILTQQLGGDIFIKLIQKLNYGLTELQPVGLMRKATLIYGGGRH